jgi:SulP family sulfate permease
MIPLASLAGVLTLVAYKMSEWREFRFLLKSDKSDILVLLLTFSLTLFFDLVVAIETGVILSCFLFMKRMSENVNIESVSPDENEHLFDENLKIPENTILYEISGPLFFGAARHFEELILFDLKEKKHLILQMSNVPFMDATGYKSFSETIKTAQEHNLQVAVCALTPGVRNILTKKNFFKTHPSVKFSPNMETALSLLN